MIEIGRKRLSDADCKYVLSKNQRSGDDGQILIPNKICLELDWNWTNGPQEVEVQLDMANLISALKFARVYSKTETYHKGKRVILNDKWFEKQLKTIEVHFGDSNVALYKLHILLSTGSRHYIKGLTQDSGLNLQEFFISEYTSLVFKKEAQNVTLIIDQDQKNLRGFCFSVFKIIANEFGDSFLKINGQEVDTKIGKFAYKGLIIKDYFGPSKLLGIFDRVQATKVLESENRFRYQKEPLQILDRNKAIYFSTEFEFSRSNKSHILFNDFIRFVETYSENNYTVIKNNEGIYQFNVLNKQVNQRKKIMPQQKIFFGPPGSGKSYHIQKEYGENWPRITFHPELDYQGFIGSYKPSVDHGAITYKFIPEGFIRAYCEAWKSSGAYFLIIEEINRGNCAQIFGDIFQLLDRNIDGYSEYPIICSPDVQSHLRDELGNMSRLEEYERLIKAKDFSRMILPQNLNILCTMNTSDQSLFPMDSAFKRRWAWQYIPIDYKDAANFHVDLGSNGNFNWGEFIEVINGKIKDHTQSEDKQLGNRFVSPASGNSITKEEFVSKVVFYLWSEIYKDEQGSGNSIFYINKDTEITFSDLFKEAVINTDIVRRFVDYNLRTGTEIGKNTKDDSYIV